MRFETVEEQLTKIAHVGRGCCCCYLLYPYPFVGQFGNYQLKGEQKKNFLIPDKMINE